jgi:pimeloyl-ACP methyl ester carboxylesterase
MHGPWLILGRLRADWRLPAFKGNHPAPALTRGGAHLHRRPSLERGGHFAALEQPDALAEEVRAFFRSLREAAP